MEERLITTLRKYIAIEYLKALFFTLLMIMMLFYIIDLIEHLDNFYREGAGNSIILKYYLFKTPGYLVNFLPFALLISAVILLVIRTRFNETVAIFSSGLSLLSLLNPIIFIALLCSALSFFTSEAIIPRTAQAARDIEATYIRHKERAARFFQNRYWLKIDEGILSTHLLDADGKKAFGFTFLLIGEEGKLLRRYDAREASYDGSWKLKEVEVLDLEKGLTLDRLDRAELKLNATFDTFYSSQKSPSDMNAGELRKYIKEIAYKGYDASRYRVDYYSRFSYLALNVIIIFLAAPFAVISPRKGAVVRGIAVSVLAAFSCWVIFSIFLAMGRSGLMDPFIASWSPDVILASVAYLIYKKLRV